AGCFGLGDDPGEVAGSGHARLVDDDDVARTELEGVLDLASFGEPVALSDPAVHRVGDGAQVVLHDLRRPAGRGQRYEASAAGGDGVAHQLQGSGLARAGRTDADDDQLVGAGERLGQAT